MNFNQSETPDDKSKTPEQPSNQQQETPPPPQGRIPVHYVLPARKPIVTYLLLGFTIGIFLIQSATDYFLNVDLPVIIGVKVNELIIEGQIWRLFTPMFLHAEILHLAFNMYALYIFGRNLERYYGHGRFLMLYLVSGIAGNVMSFYFTENPSLGASTAVFGLAAAEGVFIYLNRNFFPNASRVLRNIIFVVIMNLLLGLSSQIDNWGHMGGMIGGLAYAWFAGPLLHPRPTAQGIDIVDQHMRKESYWIGGVETVVLFGLSALKIFTAS
ncbi:MAG: rhomboid family intramembrane serine protease [Anaerolineaceae bacterium]|nr:rhomboid family intramembrane serine protease [Anaerolineaceae bacterium]